MPAFDSDFFPFDSSLGFRFQPLPVLHSSPLLQWWQLLSCKFIRRHVCRTECKVFERWRWTPLRSVVQLFINNCVSDALYVLCVFCAPHEDRTSDRLKRVSHWRYASDLHRGPTELGLVPALSFSPLIPQLCPIEWEKRQKILMHVKHWMKPLSGVMFTTVLGESVIQCTCKQTRGQVWE